MNFVIIAIALAVGLAIRVYRYRARRRPDGDEPGLRRGGDSFRARVGSRAFSPLEGGFGDVGLVASREIRERVHGRIFRVGTVLMLAAVGAIIVVPTLTKGSGPGPQKVGVVGPLPPTAVQAVQVAGKANQETINFVTEGSQSAATADLRSGRIDLAIIDATSILVSKPVDSKNSPADPGLVRVVAQYLGVLAAYNDAGLTAAQAAQISNAKPVAVTSLEAGAKSKADTTSIIGLVLLFFMLTQYCTWTLIGVMQEKSSRVVEVLLAMVRPIQLLGGKVLGIGIVALGQAGLIVGFALGVGAAVGSNLLKGSAPLALLSELLWLILGYSFYCWVYAAAGSTAERQDQVQTLALPLSLPILFSYIYSITVASSSSPSLFFKVLAYLPPTAPFCMSVLVGLSQVTWWQFTASVLLTVVATIGMALIAARIYRRAVLRTGGRVRLSEVLRRGARQRAAV